MYVPNVNKVSHYLHEQYFEMISQFSDLIFIDACYIFRIISVVFLFVSIASTISPGYPIALNPLVQWVLNRKPRNVSPSDINRTVEKA